MEIRHSTEKDFERIMELYEHARLFMAEHGNPGQWGPTQWPPGQLIHDDILYKTSYVCIHANMIIGTFFFLAGDILTNEKIFQFPHSTCRIIGQHAVCGKENLIVSEYNIEPTYQQIENGKWIGNNAYGVVHRLAGDSSVKGIGKFCLDWAYQQCGHLRVDTHGDNIIMQNLLKKIGFTYCGTIYVATDNSPRLAYEKL